VYLDISTANMCMTSSVPYSGELAYTDDSGLSSCQLQALRAPVTTSTMSSLSPTSSTGKGPVMVSACSSPTVPPKEEPSQRRGRKRTLQDLPLPLKKRACQTPSERFAAFVAILLMYLKNNGTHDPKMYKLGIQAKALVAECCRRNQMGDVHFTPLNDSMSERLHGLVGDNHWNRARTYLQIYLARHHGFLPGMDEVEEDVRLLHYKHDKPGSKTF
jgi:hypothetical protein